MKYFDHHSESYEHREDCMYNGMDYNDYEYEMALRAEESSKDYNNILKKIYNGQKVK